MEKLTYRHVKKIAVVNLIKLNDGSSYQAADGSYADGPALLLEFIREGHYKIGVVDQQTYDHCFNEVGNVDKWEKV